MSLGLFGSVGSLECALGVVGLIRVRPGGRRFHSGSLGSFGCNMGVVRFIQCRWIGLGATWGLLGSFGVVEFI